MTTGLPELFSRGSQDVAGNATARRLSHLAAGFTESTVRMPFSSLPLILTCWPAKFFNVSWLETGMTARSGFTKTIFAPAAWHFLEHSASTLAPHFSSLTQPSKSCALGAVAAGALASFLALLLAAAIENSRLISRTLLNTFFIAISLRIIFCSTTFVSRASCNRASVESFGRISDIFDLVGYCFCHVTPMFAIKYKTEEPVSFLENKALFFKGCHHSWNIYSTFGRKNFHNVL